MAKDNILRVEASHLTLHRLSQYNKQPSVKLLGLDEVPSRAGDIRQADALAMFQAVLAITAR